MFGNSEQLDAKADAIAPKSRAARLKEIRASRRLTQTDLADRLHLGQNRVSAIERGDIDHSRVETLRRYVEALGGTLAVTATFDDTTYKIA